MHTWNTIKTYDEQKLSKASNILETISDKRSLSLIKSLQKNDDASIADLIVSTGYDAETVQQHLSSLSDAGVLKQRNNNYQPKYSLNNEVLRKISRLVRALKLPGGRFLVR